MERTAADEGTPTSSADGQYPHNDPPEPTASPAEMTGSDQVVPPGDSAPPRATSTDLHPNVGRAPWEANDEGVIGALTSQPERGWGAPAHQPIPSQARGIDGSHDTPYAENDLVSRGSQDVEPTGQDPQGTSGSDSAVIRHAPEVSGDASVEAPRLLDAEGAVTRHHLGTFEPAVAVDTSEVEPPRSSWEGEDSEWRGARTDSALSAIAPTSPDAAAPSITDMPGLLVRNAEPPVSALVYWRRSLILGLIVAALGSLTLWEYSAIPDRPASPVITVATPAPNAPPLDAGMSEALRRVRVALVAHDVVTLAGMIDADGLVVGPYSGGIPESGYPIADTKSFLANVVTDARLVTPGWRSDSRGRVFLLVDGWRTRPLSLSPNSTLELTPLVVIVMQSRNGTWAIRWFLIDATGVLTQQARNVTWQAVP